MTSDHPISRKDKLRRVVILCNSFARNLAYYRTGWSQEHKQMLDGTKSDSANFWNTVSGNFVYMCVLEWCKLFSETERDYWGKIVTDPDAFKTGLLRHLELNEAALRTEIKVMRKLRDKHIAHWDLDPTGYIPMLDVAKKTVWFYQAHVVNHEAEPTDLAGLRLEIDAGYQECQDEANAVYQRLASSVCRWGS